MLIPVVPAAPRRIFVVVVFAVACRVLDQVEMLLGNCGSSCACVGVIVTACARRKWTVRAFDANTYRMSQKFLPHFKVKYLNN